MDALAVTCRCSDTDLRQVPRTGPTLLVANHPFGMLEGAVLSTLLGRIRSDVRVLANDRLLAVPELRDLVIPVDVFGKRSNVRGLRQSIEHLRTGGCLVIFPAGEVSHFQLRERAVVDSPWHTAVARMVENLASQGVPVSTVPVYIDGANSLLFQVAGMLHPRLRTALLGRELLNKRGRLVEVRIGSRIESRKLLEIPTAEERTEYLRWRTYSLAERPAYKAQTSVPLSQSRRSLARIADPAATGCTAREIESLPRECLLTRTGDLDVYLAAASQIPNALEEIGRLREVTFRAAGEGTGKPLDIDSFDSEYLHLFAWNRDKQEIVGAYRLAGTDTNKRLYTATLFQYDANFLRQIGPALELGRSFVRPEYQKGFAPLLALWRGIGAFLARNPRYRVLFGPVSISNEYQAVSRELMVAFLERHASWREWMGVIGRRNPFHARHKFALPGGALNFEHLSEVVSDLEPSRKGIPVLLRQYLKLGGKLLGFNVDPEFSDALDGLIVVDLTRTEPKLLERYLGKEEAKIWHTANCSQLQAGRCAA